MNSSDYIRDKIYPKKLVIKENADKIMSDMSPRKFDPALSVYTV